MNITRPWVLLLLAACASASSSAKPAKDATSHAASADTTTIARAPASFAENRSADTSVRVESGARTISSTLLNADDAKLGRIDNLKKRGGVIHDDVFIIGGDKTCDYEPVGAVLRNDSVHCTGTAVGMRAVLTAGHCVDEARYKNDAFAFFSGCDVEKSERGGTRYPVTKRFSHPSYAWEAAAHDFAIICLTRDPDKHYRVSTKAPKVGEELWFVGFGYSEPGWHAGGIGEKRKVKMKVSQLDAATFLNQTPKKNTCNGDSGGPVLAGTEILGVTSKGDKTCVDYGINARVDLDNKWLTDTIARCATD